MRQGALGPTRQRDARSRVEMRKARSPASPPASLSRVPRPQADGLSADLRTFSSGVLAGDTEAYSHAMKPNSARSKRGGAPAHESLLMARRGGSADLPLHGGRVPRWLGERMTRLGAVIAEAIVLEYGRDEFLRRLAHPFWFQSFGCGDGHGLALVGHHHLRHRRAEAGSRTSVGRPRPACLRRRGRLIRARRRRSWLQSATGSASTARRSRPRAASSPRSTAPRSRTGSTSICTDSSSPTTAAGSSSSRA